MTARSGTRCVTRSPPSRSVEIVAVARDADEAIRLTHERHPDVVLLDVRMPKGGGVRAAREIRREDLGVRIVAFSAGHSREAVLEMLDAGATGYVAKGISADDLITAVHRSYTGDYCLSPVATQQLAVAVNDQASDVRLLASIVENSTLAICSTDVEGKVTTWNPGAERLYGYTADEIIGRKLDVIVPEDDEWGPGEWIRRVLAGERPPPVIEADRIAKGGRRVRVSISASPLRDRSGALIGVSAIAADVSELNRAREALVVGEARHRQILDATLEGVWTLGVDATTTYVNPAMAAMLGCEPQDMVGRTMFDFVPAEMTEEVQAQLELHREGTAITREVPMRSVDGRDFCVSISASPIFDPSGEYSGATALVTDVTARKETEAEMLRLATLVESSADAIMSLTPDGRIQTWNRGAQQLYGYRATEAIGRHASKLLAEDPVSRNRLIQEVGRDGHQVQIDCRDLHKYGRLIDVSVIDSPILDATGEVIGIARVARDMTEHRAARRRESEAREFLTAITANMAEGLVALDADGRVLFLNRAAEQILGWSEDELLGRSLHDSIHFRHGDGTPFPEVECPIVRSREEHKTVQIDDDVFVCAGGRTIPVAYSSAPLQLTDTHGVVVVFRDITQQKADADRRAAEQNMLTWVGRIRDALDDGRFVLHAQPIIDLRTGKTVQHELLLRMRDRNDDSRVIPPGDFLPAAERFGLIEEIDAWVVREAAEIAGRGHPVEFNLSAQSLNNPDLVGTIADAFHAAGVRPEDVVCEITETALLKNEHAGHAFAHHLASLGFKLALDDFGTGYGGFTYLTMLPITYIKIDRSFVRQLPESNENQHIVQAIISLAAGFGRKTVAEGIEDQETLELLKEMGVDYGQGYHIGVPAPLEERFGS